MKVQSPNTQATQSSSNSAVKKTEKNAEATQRDAAVVSGRTAPNTSARAEISSRAREMATAKQVAAQTPDVREDRVEALRRQIQNGSYKVDSDAVADRLVDEHLSTLGLG
jgi:negative regulator of flagellin synthesis FlgM